MNRELKFRAWSHQLGAFWQLILGPGTVAEIPPVEKSTYQIKDARAAVLPWEQYTGFEDKNGVEIYEGDIVKDDVSSGTVEWLDGGGRFQLAWHDGCWDNLTAGHAMGYEIIGNIHENPELLAAELADE